MPVVNKKLLGSVTLRELCDRLEQRVFPTKLPFLLPHITVSVDLERTICEELGDEVTLDEIIFFLRSAIVYLCECAHAVRGYSVSSCAWRSRNPVCFHSASFDSDVDYGPAFDAYIHAGLVTLAVSGIDVDVLLSMREQLAHWGSDFSVSDTFAHNSINLDAVSALQRRIESEKTDLIKTVLEQLELVVDGVLDC